MCGIGGIISHDQNFINSEILTKMGDTLRHRGPDDEGIFIDGPVGLFHRRLAIIDLITGHQPMSNEDETIWIVFNGEIYNYQDLRPGLIQKGHIFKSSSDTEVIIHLYEEYGPECVTQLNGMFAFALYDKIKDQLFCARDHFGIKPFYYSFIKDKNFIFASEIKAIVKIFPELRQPDYAAITEYITFQFSLHEKTLFQGIKKILPGHYLIVENVHEKPNIREKKYWDVEYSTDSYHTEEYYIDQLQMLLQDSIRQQLRSDVPIGCHLSGGMDSSIVTCVASDLLGCSLHSFTGSFDFGPHYDESAYAREVSRFSGTDYHEIRPNANDFISSIEDIIYFMDEPVAGPGVFPQLFVSRLARKYVKVVLGGQGGDEIFGGYARYLVAYLEQCLKGAIFETQEEGDFVVTLDSIIPNLPLLQEYLPMLRSFWSQGVFEPMDRRYYSLINRSGSISEFFTPGFQSTIMQNDPYATYKELFIHPSSQSYINRMSYVDMKTLLPALLHVEDRTSMSVSLESRVPFLDRRIIELIARVPPTIKWKGGQSKYLLRKAVGNLIPEMILNRKDKMGFPVPLMEWFASDLNTYIREILLDTRVKERGIFNMDKLELSLNSDRNGLERGLWGLLCLELWFRIHID